MSQLVKTKRQANFKGFKRFGAFKGGGSSNKKTLYSTRSCVNWPFFGTRGPLKPSFHSRFKMAHACQKRPNLHTNSSNKLLFLALNFRLVVNMLQLIHAVKNQNN
jgi:hypothetical protein